eukprot:scaffold67979_cov36-Tisochrysis_lutea.AAC.1
MAITVHKAHAVKKCNVFIILFNEKRLQGSRLTPSELPRQYKLQKEPEYPVFALSAAQMQLLQVQLEVLICFRGNQIRGNQSLGMRRRKMTLLANGPTPERKCIALDVFEVAASLLVVASHLLLKSQQEKPCEQCVLQY